MKMPGAVRGASNPWDYTHSQGPPARASTREQPAAAQGPPPLPPRQDGGNQAWSNWQPTQPAAVEAVSVWDA